MNKRSTFLDTLADDYERAALRWREEASWYKASIHLAEEYSTTPGRVEWYRKEMTILERMANGAAKEASRLRGEK